MITTNLTKQRITQQQRSKLTRSLTKILPANMVNSTLLRSCRKIYYPQYLGDDKHHPVWIAKVDGKPRIIVYQTIAPDGYNGAISLLVGVWLNGKISNVRVISEKETPGLGDKIKQKNSNWILSFNGKSLRSLKDRRWAIKKDGGVFDQFTGATITSGAVVKAVKHVMELNKLKLSEILVNEVHCEGQGSRLS